VLEESGLSTLVSRVLIAFTIELDNEFERQVPHFTTTSGLVAPPGTPAVWLTSLVMWSNFMQFVEDGVSCGELQSLARITDEALPHYPVVSHRGGYPDGS